MGHFWIWVACTLTVNGFVEGHPIPMSVDTGSSVTLLHKEVWDNVLCRQNGLVPSTVPIMAVNGEHLAVSGEVDVLLQVGPHQRKRKVLVVDDMSQQFILGTDYLEQQHCVINPITGTLTVGMDSHCVPLYSSKQPSVCHVIVGETTVIPDEAIPVKLSQPTAIPVGIFEPKLDLAERHGILLAYSIFAVQSGQIAVEVLNPSAASVTLYGKQHVGSLHCVAEIDGISTDTQSGDVVPQYLVLKSWFQAPLSVWLIKLLTLFPLTEES